MSFPDSMVLRRSQFALGLLLLGSLLLIAAGLHVSLSSRSGELDARAKLVRMLGLTDLALFTEARYTRHPSQADLHTPFQDHPLSFDHFPTGSLIGPQRNFGPSTMAILPGRTQQ